jgi:hypothetical protein
MSRSAKPRKAYRPKHVNPKAFLLGMQGARLLSADDQLTRAANLAAAVDATAAGTATLTDWRLIFDCVNLLDAFSRMPKVMKGAAAFMDTLQGAVVDIVDRLRDTGRHEIHTDELQTLRDMQGLWADVLAVVTHQQFFQAQERVEATVGLAIAGKAPKGVRVVEAVA